MPYIDLSEQAKAMVRGRVKNLVSAVSEDLRNEIVLQMDPGPPRTGREYRMPNSQQKYQASAPGEAPAVREGVYRDSWKVLATIEDGPRVRGGVASDAKTEDGEHYIGRLLEDGTQRISKPSADGTILPYLEHIAPRPHIGPAREIVLERWGGMLRRRG